MEEVARKLSVNSESLKTGEGPKDARRLRLLDETGHTFDAQAIRGIYTVVEPLDVELPFYKETATAPGSNKTHVVEDPGQSIRLPPQPPRFPGNQTYRCHLCPHDRQQHGRKN